MVTHGTISQLDVRETDKNDYYQSSPFSGPIGSPAGRTVKNQEGEKENKKRDGQTVGQ